MKRVLVTGASGFVGRSTCAALQHAGFVVRAALRRPEAAAALPPGVEPVVSGDLAGDVAWPALLREVSGVVHLAARVHVMADRGGDGAEAYRAANVVATERLARAAAAHGVRRLLFVSSVKAVGERSLREPLSDRTAPSPEDAYGQSKLAAERALAAVAADTGLEVVVVRPPLVYGPGVGGNFRRLLTLLRLSRRVPLPLAGIENRRSFVYVGNLADAIAHLMRSPAAAGGTFFVRDDEDLSTAELLRRLGDAAGTPARLLPGRAGPLLAAARVLGRARELERLVGTLQVDDSALRGLGWSPPTPSRDAIALTARALLAAPR